MLDQGKKLMVDAVAPQPLQIAAGDLIAISAASAPHDADAMQAAIEAAASRLIEDRDDLVMRLARERLQAPDIGPRDLADRLHVVVRKSDGVEHWVLDGKPLVRFWPPKMTQDGARVTFALRYAKAEA